MEQVALNGSAEGEGRTTVYYDGSCPICRVEIAFMNRRDRDGRIGFVDVASDAVVLPADLDRNAAMRRFHVRERDGTLRDGAAAFAAMWGELPALRFLSRLAAVPGALPVLEWLYRRFLVVRPRLQTAARWLERRRA